MSTHRCAAKECSRQIPTELLLCKAHWKRVPRRVASRVWETYRGGSGEDYNQARDAAVAHVATFEGKQVTPVEALAMKVAEGWR